MKHTDDMTDAELVADAIKTLANRIHVRGDANGPESLTEAVLMCANALIDIREAINNMSETIAYGRDQ